LIAASLIATAGASAQTAAVRPILECVLDNPDGTYTAVFGYKNDNTVPVSAPVGSTNKFTPSPQDRGQTVTFRPGRTPYGQGAFVVVFPGGNLVWTLKGRTSTASPTSTRCASAPAVPIAEPDTAGTRPGTPVTIAVLANDSDPQGEPLSVARVAAPAHGSVAVNADGTLTYTPTSGFEGADSFTYVVVDTTTGSALGRVSVAVVTAPADTQPPTITAVLDPPSNAASWNNSDVTVSFTCTDAGSGVASCPPPVTLTSEGAGQTVSGTATDHAGNSASASVTINLDQTPPLVSSVISPAPNAIGWNNTDVTVTFEAQDALSGVLSVSPPALITNEGPGQLVSGQASDRAGNVGAALTSVSLDKTPPQVALTAPTDGALVRLPQVLVAGSASDARGLAAVDVNGVAVSATGDFETTLPLVVGPQTVTATARDVAGNISTAGVTLTYRPLPVVKITSPTDLAAFGTTPITVAGTVDDPDAAVVVGLQRIPATVSGTTFTATGVPLQEGGNVVTAVATNAAGDTGTDSVTLVLDTIAPRVIVDAPPAASVTSADGVSVAGRVHDVVMGTVNSGQAQVSVNGMAAAVVNRTFAARVPLVPGPNTITATVTDAVGNSDTKTLVVTRVDAAGARLAIVSGDGQTAGIGEALPEPLVVAATDGAGVPLAGRSVIFRVSANNGALLDPQDARQRALAVSTDAQGHAQARLVLGMRSGAANNRVDVSLVPDPPDAALAAPPVTFSASGVAHPPAKINVDSGNRQKGLPGQPLPRPLVAVVTDEGHNRLGGVPVTFTVVQGGGGFNGSSAVTVTTDSDGRALAILTLGPDPGVENNVATAALADVVGLPAGFSASALEPGDPADTRLSGVVLDNSNVPVPGVTLRLRGTALAATSDAQGQFTLTGVPVGDAHLVADGSTAQRPGTWPNLEFELVTVPGANNTLEMPIYLLPLDTAHSIFVDEAQGGTLTLPDYPGFALTIAPNSATFPDGTRRGTISVTAVHVDKVPMVPNFGQQPRFIVTIQPPGVRFDPPAQVVQPNVEGLAPGEITEIYSFDHDAGSFVATGTATVSPDGLTLVSDPGTGVVKSGWFCGGNPNTTGTGHDCPECQKCDAATTTCVKDAAADPTKCCGGKPYDKKKECCEAERVLPKKPISKLEDCPRREQDPQYTKSSNGCSVVPNNPNFPIPSPLPQLADTPFPGGPGFKPVCDIHDFCYDTCKPNGSNDVPAGKAFCDQQMCDNLELLCLDVTLPDLVKAQCLFHARIYCLGVSSIPTSWIFIPVQKNACQCCP
jgi:hypothetical protein